MDNDRFKRLYTKWVRAAHAYYIAYDDSGMSDAEWDFIGRELFDARDQLPAEQFPILHHPDYEGGSLYWLSEKDYPDWVN